ncbi:MAG TPA: gamma-glutamylcyclotransferase family protein [Polyangiaceae bacterium]|nr:gamma-glutamylcyclotransferase family protein [Polyangiaceae bacterium]
MAPGLFAYGTLQVPEILVQLLGRTLPAVNAVLVGYRCFRVSEKPYPGIIAEPGASVSGLLYAGASETELALLDWYEGEFYERRLVELQTAAGAVPGFAYVFQAAQRERLGAEEWDLAGFRRDHLAQYLEDVARTRRAP